MSPVFEKNGKWYYAIGSLSEVGPFDEESEAWDAYQEANKKSCPTCED